MLDKNRIVEALREVLDPEIGLNIVDLNMIRDITIKEGDVGVTIALTVPHCPLAKTLQTDVEKALKKISEVKAVRVATTSMSKKELEDLRIKLQGRTSKPSGPTPPGGVGPGIERLEKRGIRNIVAIVSGKGGVGKSFVTSMLASELRRQGYEVGVLDADLTGPSIAKVFGLTERPYKGPNGAIVPVRTKTGIKVMSINLVLEDVNQPVIWRGPIVNSVIRQLYWDVDWGDLHYLLVDLPPGCVSSDTMVYANSHPVSIDQLKPGDHVYSVDATITPSARFSNVLRATVRTRPVLEVIPQGEAELFELRTKTRSVRATFNHPILALTKKRPAGHRNYTYSLVWKRLAELNKGDIVVVLKKLPRNQVPFELPYVTEETPGIVIPSHTTDDFARIVGYFLGDGFVRITLRTRTYQVIFAEPRGGRFRGKYISLLEKVFKASGVYQDKYQFGILSRSMALLFEKLGLHRSAVEKRLPEWVFELPESQILALIEGYCDADGYRRDARDKLRRPGWMVFESPNRGLMKGLRALAMSVGLRVTNLNSRTRTLRPPSGRTYSSTFHTFECSSSTRSGKYGASLIRGNGRQSVGKGLVNENLGFERVSRITHLGRHQVYDLKVEGNENFTADGLIVHNTSDAPLTVFQSLPLDGVIVVSSPQDLASMIVTKAVNMAKKMNAPLLGLVENMSFLNCPHCGERMNLFGEPKGEELARNLGIPFLGSVPLDPKIALLSDQGLIEECSSPTFESVATELRQRAVKQVEQLTQGLPIAWAVEPRPK